MFWKIVFGIFALLFCLSISSTIMAALGGLWQSVAFQLIDQMVSLLALVSLYGFAYKKALGLRSLAIFTFIVNIIAMLVSAWAFSGFAMMYLYSGVFVAIGLTTLILLYVGIYMYPL